jgi:amino acid adenylation domain-containing protein
MFAVTDATGCHGAQDVERLSDAIAAWIRAQLDERAVCVAVYGPSCFEVVAALIGAYKAGCSYLYLDPTLPVERVEYMAATAGARLVAEVGRAPVTAEARLSLDGPIPDEPAPVVVVHPDDAAYVVYTSGSTGRPKAITISRANLDSLFETWGKQHYRVPGRGGEQVRTALLTRLAWDPSVFVVFFSYWLGYHLFLIDAETKRDGAALLRYLREHRITMTDATPNYLRMIARQLTGTGETFPLERVFCIGDVMSHHLAATLVGRAGPDFRLYNLYGPAECTIHVTYAVIDAEYLAGHDEVLIGEATANATLRVLTDGELHHDVDREGELVIFGPCVGRYLCPPPENDPFADFPGGYRTGDLVRFVNERDLAFIGRIGRQVKVNGYRIELEEIEHVLESDPVVEMARVLARRESEDFVGLYAFVRADACHAERLTATMSRQLPYYMMPTRTLLLPALPFNDNGKVDYKHLERLIDDGGSGGASIDDFVRARASELLGGIEIRDDTSLTRAGATSITLLALAGAIRRRFGVTLDVSTLYAAPTVGDIARHVWSLAPGTTPALPPPGPVAGGAPVAVLPEAARRLVTIENRTGRRSELRVTIDLPTGVSLDALGWALATVMERNDIFGRRVVRRGAGFRLEPGDPAPLELVDVIVPRSWRDGPVVQLQPRPAGVVLTVQHCYLDYLSLHFLLDDVWRLIDGRDAPARLGVTDYLSAVRDAPSGDCTRYWADQLARRAAYQGLTGDRLGEGPQLVVRRELPASFGTAALRGGLTAFQWSLLAFTRVLCERSPEITVGLYLPGRHPALGQDVLGMFSAVLPLVARADELTGPWLTAQLADLVAHQWVSIPFLYQQVPLEQLRTGDFVHVVFNFENAFEGPVPVSAVNHDPDITDRPLFFGVCETASGRSLEIKYHSGRYSPALIERLLDRFVEVGSCRE